MTASAPVHITQNCPTINCTMKVETVLAAGQTIPPARRCVSCEAARSAEGKAA